VEHRLWGDTVLGYHLVNVLFHAAAAWLLFVILRMSRGSRAAAGGAHLRPPPGLRGVGRLDLGAEEHALRGFLPGLGPGLPAVRRDAAASQPVFLGPGLFVLALLTKTVTATLPAALLVVLWWRRGKIEGRKDVLPLVPWFVLAAASGLFTAWAEKHYIGAEGADFSFTFLERLQLAGRVVAFYAGRLFWPSHLMFIYPQVDAFGP
jgi:hypothetical protein